jgi:hypothetical protein
MGRLLPIVTVLVALVATTVYAQSGPAGDLRPVSVVASGSYRGRWWTVTVNRAGELTTSVADERQGTRSLSPAERARLARLLGGLPTDRSVYRFGEFFVDASAVFEMTVGDKATARRYRVTDTLGADKDRPELVPVLDTLRFFRSLLESADALRVPEPEARLIR